ncbi:MAG TPA: hypothetical protein ENH94_01190 [Phycisphaerales bacterium]|nr:hypothetical protein [Phycisphaerales bacterium]
MNIRFVLAVLICTLCLGATGCEPFAKYERIVKFSGVAANDIRFVAETHNGSVTVNGIEGNVCVLTAVIVARSDSVENAQKLAEQIDIKLVQSGTNIKVKIDKPLFIDEQYVSINLEVLLPIRVRLNLTTHNGTINITDIIGEIKAVTHNGSINTKTTSGGMDLETHNGRIECRQLIGDLRVETHNGSANIAFSEKAASVCNANISTYNGGISVRFPPETSSILEASTHNGSIRTELDITMVGTISDNNIKGILGAGEGEIKLKTHNGSIRIRK